jgi:peptidoglycan-N-acetylglucosamine deacetylase
MRWQQNVLRRLKGSVVTICSRPPMMRRLCWRADSREPRIALTFDDGPHPEHTPKVLDLLAAHGVQATFFVVGALVERQPQIFERTVREGHHIGNHSYNHSRRDFVAQIRRTEAVLESLGVRTRFFRPPHGLLQPSVLWWALWHGYSVAMWSHDSRDALRHQGKATTGESYSDVESGDIVLMHDDNPICHAELGQVLEVARAKGLQVGTLPQLMDAAGRVRASPEPDDSRSRPRSSRET